VYPVVCICQKLWNLAESRQSYCNTKWKRFIFGPPCRPSSFEGILGDVLKLCSSVLHHF